LCWQVSFGWLCENSETRNRDRTNISSKPRVQCAKIERVFSSDLSKKNILVAFQFFAFLHTQGQDRRMARVRGTSAYLQERQYPDRPDPTKSAITDRTALQQFGEDRGSAA
jgi:hypothetical protein